MDERLVVCAWCGRVIRHGSRPVSHGICPRCQVTARDPTANVVARRRGARRSQQSGEASGQGGQGDRI